MLVTPLYQSSKNIFMSVTIFGLVSEKFHKKMVAQEGSEIFVSDNLGDAATSLRKRHRLFFMRLNQSVINSTMYVKGDYV